MLQLQSSSHVSYWPVYLGGADNCSNNGPGDPTTPLDHDRWDLDAAISCAHALCYAAAAQVMVSLLKWVFLAVFWLVGRGSKAATTAANRWMRLTRTQRITLFIVLCCFTAPHLRSSRRWSLRWCRPARGKRALQKRIRKAQKGNGLNSKPCWRLGC